MNPDAWTELVLDTGPLSHLARAGWLSVLRYVAESDGRNVVITEGVRAELVDGVHQYPHLQQILDANWVTVRRLTSPRELADFGLMAQRLIVRNRNVGEAEVLAYAKANDQIAVVDDGPGRKAAKRYDIELKPTLALLCDAVRKKRLTVDLVSSVADQLLETEYRLPFPTGGFKAWAAKENLC